MSKKNKSIYIMSTQNGSGKKAAVVGLYKNIEEYNKKPGYFKPIGNPFNDVITETGKYVNIIHKVLKRKYSKDEISPIFISPTSFLDEIPLEEVDEIKNHIKNTFKDIADESDIVLVEGNHFYQQMNSIGLNDTALAKLLGSEVVLISRCDNDTDLDKVLYAAEKINNKNLVLKGVIFSNVSDLQMVKINEKYTKILAKKQIELLGTIPKSRVLNTPTITEVIGATQGKLLTGDNDTIKNTHIKKFIIGAMQSTDALAYMRKGQNLGVITGGDRSDIIVTAVEVGVSLIILTGNLMPDMMSIAKAKESNIPVILVSSDTYTTAHNIQNIHTHIQDSDIDLCKAQIKDNINWKKLL